MVGCRLHGPNVDLECTFIWSLQQLAAEAGMDGCSAAFSECVQGWAGGLPQHSGSIEWFGPGFAEWLLLK
jgi:hypothetical protein